MTASSGTCASRSASCSAQDLDARRPPVARARHRGEHGAVHGGERPAPADRERRRARAPGPVQPCRPERHGPELERLRLLGDVGTRNVRSTFSFPMIEQLRAANTTLTGLAAGVPMGA
jgi:hypothetical protein